MNYLKSIILVLFTVSIQAQESNLLIKKDLINDWSNYPIFPYLIDSTSADKQ
ncbi:hypothetical protein GCM10011312_25920 [Planktosalinus lacus]|uniref:Uncharacterized protein n=1 Tax=Planktosalinus lacus TaxID=1526573 RepID=A0A8J2VEA3_9FLAO|nr:hypothetical protein GCM10011312_25920 [Planktosalinus lacus]